VKKTTKSASWKQEYLALSILSLSLSWFLKHMFYEEVFIDPKADQMPRIMASKNLNHRDSRETLKALIICNIILLFLFH
jgi:hypothetical protein